MKKTIFILAAILICSFIKVFPQDSSLRRKADLHFNNGEWMEALQDFDLLLQEDPRNREAYAYTVISAMKIADYTAVAEYMVKAETYRILPDTLLPEINRLTRELGYPALYETLLKELGDRIPSWKKKTDYYLLDYYRFRRQHLQVVRIIDEMTGEGEENAELLKIKAHALSNACYDREALKCYERVMELLPDDPVAYVFAGNYYYLTGLKKLKEAAKRYNSLSSPTRMQYGAFKKEQREVLENEYEKAVRYLETADRLQPTPALKKTLYDIYVQRADVTRAEAVKRSKKE